MKKIFLLHGFLGSSQDWDPVKDHIDQDRETKIVTPNFLSLQNKFEPQLLVDDLESFDSLITKLRALHEIDFVKNEKRIFVGYSLGGRIGLNWLRQFPNDFDHWVFVSTNPGLRTEKDRADRAQSDQAWLDQLHKDNLEEFCAKWNNQAVFHATNENFQMNQIQLLDRLKLTKCFSSLSLAKQQDHREIIKKNEKKLTWVVGKNDEKFVYVAEELRANRILKDFISMEAGHRVHLDQPASLAHLILRL